MISLAKRERAQQARAIVGVDAGKYQHVMVIRPHGCGDTKPFAFDATRAGFEGARERILSCAPDLTPPTVLVGIEFASNYGFTFAHYLREAGFQIVSVLPAHTKRWKEVTLNQPLKTDAKDAGNIADLTSIGHFVSFPFLEQEYADLRYLVSARERVSVLRSSEVTRLRSVLQVVFPEFEEVFPHFNKKTPFVVLREFPSPDAVIKAPKRRVLKVIKDASRGHLGEAKYQQLLEAARRTIALPGAQSVLKDEIPMLLRRIEVYTEDAAALEEEMVRTLHALPEAEALLTVPGLAPVTAAVFLGCIGDPRAYESGKQILKLAGLTLIERSSGILRGKQRISKRGKPVLRRFAYLFAVRSVQEDGIFRAEFERMVQRNGGRKIAALVALSRKALRLMYQVAKHRAPFDPARLG
jgi:transposase